MEDYPQSNAEDPSALKTLLALLANEDAKVQDDVRHAYYFLCKGDPNSVSFQLSIWLAALHRAYGRVAVKSSSVNGNNGQAQVLESLASVPKSVAQALEPIIHEQTQELRKELTPEKKGEGTRFQKALAFVADRRLIAVACLAAGALPFLLLYVAAERERAVDATSRIVAIMNRLPDSVRLNMTGNIQFSPAADGKPAKAVLNFGEKLRPVTAEVTRAKEVSVLFAP
jgi:hypothetical protein